jgi:hypothetical protein
LDKEVRKSTVRFVWKKNKKEDSPSAANDAENSPKTATYTPSQQQKAAAASAIVVVVL